MSERNQDKALYQFGPFRVNVGERVLTKGQAAVPLTPKAFDTLVVLIRNSGRIVEKEALLKEVWPDTFVEEGVLAVNVAAIRKALSNGEDTQSFIETVPRRGYRFVADVESVQGSSEGRAPAVNSQQPKSRINSGVITVALIVLVVAGVGWYLAQLRPSSNTAVPLARSVPLTSYPGAELSPTFSPDASQVAFSWNGPQQDNFDIYVKLVDSGDPVRLTHDPAPDMSPAWSPDGRQIAFLRQGSVFLVSPLGGPETKVADVQANRIAWTPDCQSLAVNSGPFGKTRIVLISAESGETIRNLTSPTKTGFSFGDIGFAISPDGLHLAFARFPDSTVSSLFLTPMSDGMPKPLTEAGPAIWGLAWTVDGKELIYSAGGLSTSATLWRRRIGLPSGTKSERIDVAQEGSVNPVIARTVQGMPGRMAYERIALDTNIWVMEAGQPASRRRVVYSTRRDADPQFSPDGRHLAFASNRSGVRQIWVCDSDGSNQRPLTSFKPGQPGVDSQRTVFANAPRWSPDGRFIVFAASIDNNRDIYIISPEGGSPRRLTTDPSQEGRPSWSRDGRSVYFYSTRSGQMEIWKMPADGGKAEQITTGRGHESLESPDGKILYYEYETLGLRSLATGEAGPKTGSAVLSSIGQGWWALGDKGIYFVEFEESGSFPWRVGGASVLFNTWGAGTEKISLPIKLYDFATHSVTPLGVIDKEVDRNFSGFSITNDGRRIAWAQIDHAETDLMMIENFR